MCIFHALIVVMFLACCYDATTFATNMQPLSHEYGQIGRILFYKWYGNFIIEIRFSCLF